MTDSDGLRKSAEPCGSGLSQGESLIPGERLANKGGSSSALLRLASESAGHVTGQVLRLDGGRSIDHPRTRPA